MLASGGMDSAALIAHYLAQGAAVYPVYVRSGYLWEKAELFWLKRLLKAMAAPGLKPLVCLSGPVREELLAPHWGLSGRGVPDARSADEAIYLPGRNMLLCLKAAMFCAPRRISLIAIGTLKGNPFPDAQKKFFLHYAKSLSLGLDHAISIAAPFAKLDKKDVIGRAGALPWRLTFSCLRPSGLTHCGRCNKCAERKRALL